MKTQTYENNVGPTRWKQYLLFDDASGLDASELEACARWIAAIALGLPVDVDADWGFREGFDYDDAAYPEHAARGDVSNYLFRAVSK